MNAPPPDRSEEAAPVEPGVHLGKYEITRRLAVGGMAELFLARVTGLLGFEKPVVIKRILPHLAQRADFIEMFLDEARIATLLVHPNIVQTYDVGVADHNYFIAMEYLHGENLRAITKALHRRKDRLPLSHAMSVAIGVAAGLHYAHERQDIDGRALGIVHRDVTPQNIIVTYEGGVKLVDFGIAKAQNRFSETRSGTLKGKLPYMSPEQCRGEPMDRRSDVFSLGILIYELTLGRRLYAGASDFQILKQIVEGEVTLPSTIDPEYDPALEKIVMRALHKAPEARHQTARELQIELEELARRERLYVSPIALQEFLRELFGATIEAWRQAKSQGKTLGQHLVESEVVIDLTSDEPAEGAPADIGRLPAGEESSYVATAASGNIPSARLRFQQRKHRRRRVVGLALAVLAMVAMGGGYALTRVRRASSTPIPPAAPSPSAPPAAASPAAPSIGTVEVETVPAGAALVVDGKSISSTSPTTLSQIDATRAHELRVHLAGYEELISPLSVPGGGTLRLRLQLRPVPTQQVGSHGGHSAHTHGSHAGSKLQVAEPKVLEGEGTLMLASEPWCAVVIDGQERGNTPLTIKLHAGTHQVLLTNPEFKVKRSLSVTVLPNQILRKRLDFGAE